MDSAGVGDKTKDLDAVTTERLKRVEEGPDVTHVMAFMFAGELALWRLLRDSGESDVIWGSFQELVPRRSS